MIAQYQRQQKVVIPLEKMVPGGKALGRLPDGRPVFVKGGAPGEEAEVALTKIKKDFAEANFLQAITSSPDRVTAPFSPGALAGADWHYLSYPAQLTAKHEMVTELLQTIARLDTEVAPVVPAEKEWRYRNKVELTFGLDDQGRVALGFHKPGRFDEILPTTDIALFPEIGQEIIAAITDWANREQLTVFEPRRSTGLLRNLVIRRGAHTNDLLINLVTTPGQIPVESLKAISYKLKANFVWSQNSSVATIVRVDELEIIAGRPGLIERFLDTEIHYGADSFFQTNTEMAEKLATQVLARIDELKPTTLIDGYAGVGGFGLFAAARGTKVVSIESHPASSRDAQANAARLGVTNNMSFINEPMEEYLRNVQFPISNDQSLLIVDPPRAGLHPKALKAIGESGVGHVIYVSCGPATLARDLHLLTTHYNLQPKIVQPFDLFPQTSHVETLVVLERS